MSSRLPRLFISLAAASSIVTALFLTVPASAAQNGDFDYPELLVTPRASERITSEAAKESGSRWTSQFPIQLSAATTLVAGISQLANPDPGKDPNGITGIAGVTVGGVWLATTLALEAFYQPYTSAEREISVMPAKTPREQLIRERYSEEALQSAARLGWRLKWLSVLSNLGTNVYMATQARSSSFSQVMDGVGALFSLAPLVFHPHWQDVACEQENYKKRIYAPIASATVFREPGTGSVAPGAVVMMSF